MSDLHSCCLPYVMSLQKGLLNVNNGDFRSGTVLAVDAHSLQPVHLSLVHVKVQLKQYIATQSAILSLELAMILLQACHDLRWVCCRDAHNTGESWATHFNGETPTQAASLSLLLQLTLTSCLERGVLIYFQHSVGPAFIFLSLISFWETMQNFRNNFITILSWMELYSKWAVPPNQRPDCLYASTVISHLTHLAPKLYGQRCLSLHEMTGVCTAEPRCPWQIWMLW